VHLTPEALFKMRTRELFLEYVEDIFSQLKESNKKVTSDFF